MKKLNSIPCFTLILLFVTSAFINADAQTTDERLTVKNWIISNKDKVTLISANEYQSMSPAVKAIINADSKSLVYKTEVTVEDIQKFQSKNTNTNLVAFKAKTTAQEKATLNTSKATTEQIDRVSVKNWIEGPGKEVKIISQSDYMSISQSHRTAVGMTNVLVYPGSELTMKDIQNFESQN